MIPTSKENMDKLLKVEKLYYTYRKLMYKEAYVILNDIYLAEDAVHESFIRIINNLHKIDMDNYPRTRAFLVSICKNVSKDIYRKKKHESALDENISTEDVCIVSDPQDIMIKNNTLEQIINAIEMLNFIYRDAFLLARVYGFSVREISEKFGITAEAVKKRLVRARVKIIKNLEMEEAIIDK